MIVSDEQQLLLNIVRIQFEDRPIFVNVDTITTSNTLTAGVDSNFSYDSTPSRTVAGLLHDQMFSLGRAFTLSPNLSYSDSPTISFSPLQGEAWMRHILKPISMDDVYLLLASEWSSQKVMRVVFERIFTMYNESKFSDTGEPRIPDNEQFIEFTRYLTYLEEKHMIFFSTSKIDHILIPKGMTPKQALQDENFR